MFGTSWAAVIAAIIVFCAVGGCGSRTEFAYDALDPAPPHEELAELSLGEYRIPIPVAGDRRHGRLSYGHRLQLDFELHALVAPSMKPQVAEVWNHHEGRIRDQVIRVCRKATVDELQEPELGTLKARLMDALASQMGNRELRKLVLTEVASQEL